MKRLCVGAVLTGAAFAIAACTGDPNASLRNGPASLNVQPKQLFIDSGLTDALVVTARDGQLNPVAVTVTITSANPNIAKVARDSTRPVVDSSQYPFVVTAGSPGQVRLNVSGGGLTDSAVVNVLPLNFSGAISTLTPKGGDTITVHATSVLKFDTSLVSVTFGPAATGTAGFTTFKSADSVRVLVPYGTGAGPLTLTGVALTFIPGQSATLPTSSIVTPTGDFWAGDSSWQTAPDITGILPAKGKTAMIYSTVGAANVAVCPEGALGFGSSGPCMMFKFTLPDTATYTFSTDWDGAATNPDVDVYVCADSAVANFGAACFEDGGNGATSSKPQTTGPANQFVAGTHWFVIENYAGAASKNFRTTIKRF